MVVGVVFLDLAAYPEIKIKGSLGVRGPGFPKKVTEELEEALEAIG
jgi:hypothetical protein